MLGRMWRKANPCAQLLGMYIGAATMEKSMEVSQKLKTELPYDPKIPLLGKYIQRKWKQDIKNISALHIYCSIFHNSQDMKQPKFGWMNG